jgi:hypothetical protein
MGIADTMPLVSYARDVLKATVVILLSAILGFGALMAIRAESKSRLVRASIAGLAFVVLAIVLRPEKPR